jgi:hypothetical protein
MSKNFTHKNIKYADLFSLKEIPAWVAYAFRGRIKTDKHGRLMCAHQSLQGRIIGWEVDGHAMLGDRHLFFAHIGGAINRIILSPWARNILHMFAEHGRPGDFCLSTGGDISPEQESVIKMVTRGTPTLVFANDTDVNFIKKIERIVGAPGVILCPNPRSQGGAKARDDEFGRVDIEPVRVGASPLGMPGGPVSIEQLDAIFKGCAGERSPNQKKKAVEKSAPLLAFF